jgi:hypothetical protein
MMGRVKRHATEAQIARSRRVLIGMILIAWVVEIVIGLATRHILFLAAVSLVDAYLVFRLSRGRKGPTHARSSTP